MEEGNIGAGSPMGLLDELVDCFVFVVSVKLDHRLAHCRPENSALPLSLGSAQGHLELDFGLEDPHVVEVDSIDAEQRLDWYAGQVLWSESESGPVRLGLDEQDSSGSVPGRESWVVELEVDGD